jgi:hypothetical protein
MAPFSGIKPFDFLSGHPPSSTSSGLWEQGMFYPEPSANSASAPRRLKGSNASTSTVNRNDDVSKLQDGMNEIRINHEPNLDAFEAKFAEQLRDLDSMGFNDKSDNIKALLAAGGNVNSAVEYLLARK